jgi:hypothetical protein
MNLQFYIVQWLIHLNLPYLKNIYHTDIMYITVLFKDIIEKSRI